MFKQLIKKLWLLEFTKLDVSSFNERLPNGVGR